MPLELIQARTEEAWRLQAVEHDAARDGQTRLQNPEDLTQLTVLSVSSGDRGSSVDPGSGGGRLTRG